MRFVGLVAFATACYAPTVPTGIACPDGACPNGQTCIAGFCDGSGDTNDGSVIDDMPSIDAALGAWAVPTKVPALSSPMSNDWGPSISVDELTLYSNTDAATPGAYTIYVSTRPSKQAMWGPLLAIPPLDMAEDEYHADISIDGLELVYAADLAPAGLRRLTRASASQPWSAPEVLQLDGKEAPSLFANDRRMVLTAGNTIQEFARTSANATWTLQRNHSSLNGHRLPAISADGLEIYVIRARRMYRATRMSVDQPFGMPEMVSFGMPFDSYELFDPELSADGHTMYLSVDSGTGSLADIYVTTR